MKLLYLLFLNLLGSFLASCQQSNSAASERARFDFFPTTKTSSSSLLSNYSAAATATVTVTSTITTGGGGGFFGFNNKVTVTETKTSTIMGTTTATIPPMVVTAPAPPPITATATTPVTTTTTATTPVTTTTTVMATTTVTTTTTVSGAAPPQPTTIPIEDAINVIVAVVNAFHPKSSLLDFIDHLIHEPRQSIDLDVLWKIVQEIAKASMRPKPFPIFALMTNPMDTYAIADWVKEQLQNIKH